MKCCFGSQEGSRWCLKKVECIGERLFVLEVVGEFAIFQLLIEVGLVRDVRREGGGVGVWMRGKNEKFTSVLLSTSYFGVA